MSDVMESVLAELRELNRKQPKVSYDVPEAAAMTGCSESQIRRMITDGELGKVPHLGRSVRIPHVELERRFGAVEPDDADPHGIPRPSEVQS